MAKGDMSFTFNESELQQLMSIMGDISEVDKRQAIINSLRKSTRKMVNKGKSNLATRNKKKTGNLIGSFKTSSSKKKVVAYAGFSRSGEKKGNHAHLVDRGTAKRWTKKGYYRGSVSKGQPNKGTNFWTESVMSEGGKAMNDLKETIYQELSKITNRRK